jgi:hypothetical protein
VAKADPQERILAALHGGIAARPRWICQVFTTQLPVTGAAIVEMTDMNRGELVCATDDVSETLETLHLTLSEGPCVQAVSTGRPVLVPDLREVRPTRWPMFTEAANRTPARAVYSFPLRIRVINMGVLDLYRDQPGPLTDVELAGALLCTDVALWAPLGRRAGTDPDLAASQWDLDLPRVETHQATGMVMSQLGISTESALETLCAFALSHGQPLDELARQVVTRRLRFPVEDQR